MIDAHARAVELAAADLTLAADLRPPAGEVGPARQVLLTGATGFLGAAVLAQLLAQSDARIVCLVRGEDVVRARARVGRELDAAAGRSVEMGERVRIVLADLARPGLGIDPAEAVALADEVDLVLHCAAKVNWARSYERLRAVNVRATLELARLCCTARPKALIFVSTLGVCYAQGAPERIDERTEMTSFLEGMPLGYALGKCVAERLLRDVADRGLPVTILRAGLICADSRTGRTNPEDIVSRMIVSAARSRCTPDVDWRVDACPVDHVADVLVGLARECGSGSRTLHLQQSRPRHWREVVAWLNLAGHRAVLTPYAEWLDHVRQATADSDPALYPLRPFFLARPRVLGGDSLPELYFERNRRRIESTRSRTTLDALGLCMPALDGALLGRSTEFLAAAGHLPAAPRRPSPARAVDEVTAALAGLLRAHFVAPRLEVLDVERTELEGGILGELYAWKLGPGAGVSRCRVAFRRAPAAPVAVLDLVLKRKPGDEVVFEVCDAVAAACDPVLAHAFRAHGRALEFSRSQVREPAIYRLAHPGLRRHSPRFYGSVTEKGGALVALAMEFLGEAVAMGPAAVEPWSDERILVAVRGAARIHAAFLGATASFAEEPWLVRQPDAQTLAGMRPLLHALAEHAAPFFSQWWQEPSLPLQRRIIQGAPECRAGLAELPDTLIHNDFNPRNLVLRGAGADRRICVFDWELATIGAPQQDLAELLCFTLPADAELPEVLRYVEEHRRELEACSGRSLDPLCWRRGFGLALRQLLLTRLPMYTVIHRIRPQVFLPRTLANWRRLHAWFESASSVAPGHGSVPRAFRRDVRRRRSIARDVELP